MKTFTFILVALIAFSSGSFTIRSAKKRNFSAGVYGVCACTGTNAHPVQVELTLNNDNTFHYINNSDRSNTIDVKGNWELSNNTITLKNYTSPVAINDSWKVDKNEKCLKSRKGMLFTRLCNVKECK